jgi:ppGpp synthetase/RelA/SpoT-type nucleotidyltranferase
VTDVEQARQRWTAERPRYADFGELVAQRLRDSLKPLGVWFHVEARAKTIDSLVKKLLTKQRHTFESLPDKVGARVIIRYRTDVEKVIDKVRTLFDSTEPEDKEKLLGIDRVGYLSIHLDNVRLHKDDGDAAKFPPSTFWVELQVRTLAQHLWSEMSHDTVYKNQEMIADLDPDVRRRVLLMAGQLEIADREFDRLNMELSTRTTVRLLQVLEQHYYTLASQRPNLELSVEVLDVLRPLVPQEDIGAFAIKLNEFLAAKHSVIEKVYEKARELGIEDAETPAFLFQPEVLLIYNLLTSARDKTREVWNEKYPDRELERIANAFGVSLD